ncbi:MAG TPA: MSHA biogenesis protein MshE, partial [Pseudomonadales bacterium]|nr:MSHA biogenesis protein MshE [Pseudomonadales bacterium]
AMRLIDMGAAPYVAASALRAIIAQRLVRKICENCKTEFHPDPQQRAWLMAIGGHQFIDQAHYFHGRGCHQCNNTGYKGRLGVYELLELEEATTDALRRNDPGAFAQAARASGFKTLAACALDYATQGLTSLDEVFRVAAELEKIGEEI